jgi:hypothetical protein
MATTYLTNGLTAGSGTIGTVSLWVKRSTLGTSTLYHFFEDNVTFCRLRFDSSDVLHWETYDNNTSNGKFKTTRVFRDTSAFYHIVVRVDTTQSAQADRVRIYVNGTQETSFGTANYPTQNRDVKMTAQPYIGTEWQGSGVNYFDGNMTHVHYTDGQSYAASTFGETDSTSGIWKPKTSPSVTYGSKGFFLKFENSGSMGTDSSGNGNNFTTIGGTLTQSPDTPSNNFAVMNPLDNYYTVNSFSNGNTTVTTPNSGYSGAVGAMGASAGKWYFECKPVSKTGDADEYAVGITGAPVTSVNQPQWKLATGYMYGGVNGNVFNNDSGSAYGSTYTAGDIIGVAMDLDNNKLYFSKNGTFQNSGVPTSGSTGTGATSITAASSTPIEFYMPCCAFSSNSYGAVFAFNFGSGYFQTTAVTSANADGNGIGAFEYAVPTGYYALCTKNIKEFG